MANANGNGDFFFTFRVATSLSADDTWLSGIPDPESTVLISEVEFPNSARAIARLSTSS